MLLALRSLWERIIGPVSPPTEGRILGSVDQLNSITATVALNSQIVATVDQLSRIVGSVE
jgi:hypothetical protein